MAVIVGGGGGGAAAGAGAGTAEGFLDAGGGIGGFLPTGRGGLGLLAAKSVVESEACDVGRELFLRAATPPGGGGANPGGGGGAPGGLGAAPLGGNGAGAFGGGLDTLRDEGSGSESYAPVLTPPDFLSFGIPPAKRPPSCGAADSIPPPDGPLPCPWSLLLRALLGAGGRRPGTGGAPPIGGPASLLVLLPNTGAERSFTTPTFFSRVPLLMSLSSAP